MASRVTSAPSSVGAWFLSEPPKAPMAVRTAETIKTSDMVDLDRMQEGRRDQKLSLRMAPVRSLADTAAASHGPTLGSSNSKKERQAVTLPAWKASAGAWLAALA